MDLAIPYTFYPIALPHWMAWALFLLAMLGGVATGVARGRVRGGMRGVGAGLVGGGGLLFATLLESLFITFFVRAGAIGAAGAAGAGLVAGEILVGRQEVGHRIEVLQARRVEEAGQVDGVLGRVHRDLHDTVRDDRDGALGVTPRPPQRSPHRAPRRS